MEEGGGRESGADGEAGMVATDRESEDGDGQRVDGRRRRRVRRHEVQSIAVTAGGRPRKMRPQCCCSYEELYWWKECWICHQFRIQCKRICMGTKSISNIFLLVGQ